MFIVVVYEYNCFLLQVHAPVPSGGIYSFELVVLPLMRAKCHPDVAGAGARIYIRAVFSKSLRPRRAFVPFSLSLERDGPAGWRSESFRRRARSRVCLPSEVQNPLSIFEVSHCLSFPYFRPCPFIRDQNLTSSHSPTSLRLAAAALPSARAQKSDRNRAG